MNPSSVDLPPPSASPLIRAGELGDRIGNVMTALIAVMAVWTLW